MSRKSNNLKDTLFWIFLILLLVAIAKYWPIIGEKIGSTIYSSKITRPVISFNLDEIPEFDESTPYVVINENKPDFNNDDYKEPGYEYYGELDELGRCTVTFANVGIETMPTEPRESISEIRPTRMAWNKI
jgi:hypothetical protein